MKIYLAASGFGWLLRQMDVNMILLTYYRLKMSDVIPGYDLFLDSGGFSARSMGAEISIFDYADFVERYSHLFSVYANLDTNSTEQTEKHQKYLESRGLNPLPVYHFSEYEDPKYKDQIVEMCNSYDYVCLGGLVGLRDRNAKKEFLEYCFEVAIETKTKIHGFGVTDMRSLLTYPFYSVDSSSWSSTGRFGGQYKFNHGYLQSIPQGCSTEPSLRKRDYYWQLRNSASEWMKFIEIQKTKGGYWDGRTKEAE